MPIQICLPPQMSVCLQHEDKIRFDSRYQACHTRAVQTGFHADSLFFPRTDVRCHPYVPYVRTLDRASTCVAALTAHVVGLRAVVAAESPANRLIELHRPDTPLQCRSHADSKQASVPISMKVQLSTISRAAGVTSNTQSSHVSCCRLC